MTAYLAGAFFTTFYCHWKVYWLFCLLFAGTSILVSGAFYLQKFKISRKDILIPLCSAGSICLLFMLVGFFVELQTPYSIEWTTCRINGKTIEISKAYPKVASKAVIVYLYSSDTDTYEKAIRRITRPLLAKGYTVFPIGVSSGMDGLALAEYTIKEASIEAGKNKCRLLLIGQGDGGKHALVAASKLNSTTLDAVAALGSPASWPFEEISPDMHIKDIKASLLLVHGKNDELYPYTDSIALKKLCDKYGVPASLEIVDDAGAVLDEKKASVIERLDTFFSDSTADKVKRLAKGNNCLTGKDL